MRVTLSASSLRTAINCLTAAIAIERRAESRMALNAARLELRRALRRVEQPRKARTRWKLSA